MIINLSLTFVLFLVGVWGLCISRNIVKSIISLNICQMATILLSLNLFYKPESSIPILPFLTNVIVDPLPQAFMITNIVIGASITSLSLMFCVKLFHHYGSLDWNTINKKMDAENPDQIKL